MSELDAIYLWKQELYAIESLAQYPKTRAICVFVFEVGERAWRAAVTR